MSIEEFRDRNDGGYMRWLADHPDGYLINIQRTYNPNDARLHAADCRTISGTPARGRTFTGDWIKVCAASLAELDAWALQRLRVVVQRCPTCQPPDVTVL